VRQEILKALYIVVDNKKSVWIKNYVLNFLNPLTYIYLVLIVLYIFAYILIKGKDKYLEMIER